MTKIWTVCTITYGNGMHYVHAWPITSSATMESQMQIGPHVDLSGQTYYKSYHLCATKKEALRLTEYWRDGFRTAGAYID